MVTENLEAVRREIRAHAEKAGRNPDDVLLLAVSKTKPESDIRALYEAGQRDFGENYVQELCEKQSHLPKDIRWHMIGHLQRNKVKYIAPFVALIHSVDSFGLAEVIEKEAVKKGNIARVLVKKGESTFLNVPLNAGLAGTILGLAVAPWALITSALVTLGLDCTIELVKTDGETVELLSREVGRKAVAVGE